MSEWQDLLAAREVHNGGENVISHGPDWPLCISSYAQSRR